jgi:hypothetical protein
MVSGNLYVFVLLGILSLSIVHGHDPGEEFRKKALNELLQIKEASATNSRTNMESHSLNFIESYKQAMRYDSSRRDYTFRRDMHDCWKVLFNLANKFVKLNMTDKALYYFNELENLDSAHSPMNWWRVFSAYGNALAKAGNIKMATRYFVKSCSHAAVEIHSVRAIKICEVIKHRLGERNESVETDELQDVLRRLAIKNSIPTKMNVPFRFNFFVSKLDDARNMDRNFGFMRYAAQRERNLISSSAPPTADILHLSFTFDDCGVYGWRDRLDHAKNIPTQSVRIRWEDECPAVGSTERPVYLCTSCVGMADVFLFAYSHEMSMYKEFAKDRVLIHGPQCASPYLFFAPARSGPVRTIDVLLSGFSEGVVKSFEKNGKAWTQKKHDLYPFRKKLVLLAQTSYFEDNFGFQITVRAHPGYGNCSTSIECRASKRSKKGSEEQLWSYSQDLKRAKIVIVTRSSRNYSLRKYVEASMAGALLVGNIPENDEQYRAFMVEINEHSTNHHIGSTIKYWLEHDKEREKRAKRGQKHMLVIAERTWQSWIKAAMGGAILFKAKRYGMYSFAEARSAYKGAFHTNNHVHGRCNGIYHGWVGHGNLGDDGMLRIFLIVLSQQLFSNKPIKVQYLQDQGNKYCQEERASIHLSRNTSFDLNVLGGGSIFHRNYLRNFERANGAKFVFGTGYDDYNLQILETRVVDALQHNTIETLGIGLKGTESTKYKNVYGGTRGMFSKTVIGKTFGENMPMVRDSGLLAGRTILAQISTGAQLASLKALREKYKLTESFVVFNFGQSPYYKVYGGSNGTTAVKKRLVELARFLQDEKHLDVIFVPTWKDDVQANNYLAQASGVKCTDGLLLLQDLLVLLKHAKLVVGHRLHAGVFAASVKTPFILFAYRLKSYDFATSNEAFLRSIVSHKITLVKLKSKARKLLEIGQEFEGVLADTSQLYERLLQEYIHKNRNVWRNDCFSDRGQTVRWCVRNCKAVSKHVEGFAIFERC